MVPLPLLHEGRSHPHPDAHKGRKDPNWAQATRGFRKERDEHERNGCWPQPKHLAHMEQLQQSQKDTRREPQQYPRVILVNPQRSLRGERADALIQLLQEWHWRRWHALREDGHRDVFAFGPLLAPRISLSFHLLLR